MNSVPADVEIHNEDAISGMRARLADESVDCLVTSIPFGALFSYSHKTEDVGNCRDGVDFVASQFGLHMRFWFEQVRRVMAPGAVVCIHVQQLNTTQVQHGHQGLRDFRGAVIDMARRHGLHPHGEVAIPKNPQRVAQVRKLHSLLFVTGRRDSRALVPCNNDFVLFFRKPGEGRPVRGLYDVPRNPSGHFTQEDWIRWARGVWEDGWRDEAAMLELDGYREALEVHLREEWRGAPVWGDIVETDVLDGWRSARGSDEEKHVCPLQLEVIRRCLLLYTAPGDLVLDPFMGIGSTAYVAIELRRRVVGFELKESYHLSARRNVARALELVLERAAEAVGQRALSFDGAAAPQLQQPAEEEAPSACPLSPPSDARPGPLLVAAASHDGERGLLDSRASDPEGPISQHDPTEAGSLECVQAGRHVNTPPAAPGERRSHELEGFIVWPMNTCWTDDVGQEHTRQWWMVETARGRARGHTPAEAVEQARRLLA